MKVDVYVMSTYIFDFWTFGVLWLHELFGDAEELKKRRGRPVSCMLVDFGAQNVGPVVLHICFHVRDLELGNEVVIFLCS